MLVLDEPTSGMDVFAQRSTWTMLQNTKRGRIIILTTHSMEEADVLGDRIGIMSEGRVICSGSPMFLKRAYGVGYSLVVTSPALNHGEEQSPRGGSRKSSQLLFSEKLRNKKVPETHSEEQSRLFSVLSSPLKS